MKRIVASVGAAALAGVLTVAGSPARATDNPPPTLQIVTARLHYPGPQDKRLQVALTDSCPSARSATLGLIVTTEAPQATTDDLLECTDKVSTELVLLSSVNGMYQPNRSVKITASLRTPDNKILVTETKTLNVEENFDYTVGTEPPPSR